MHNVFLLYMPPGNMEAMVHYEDTIKQKVSLERISTHVSRGLRDKLAGIFGPHRIAVWGSRAGSKNRANYESMGEGDDILIVEGKTIKLLGKVAAKTVNRALSKDLWQSVSGKGGEEPWELIYFIANPRELNLPFAEFERLFKYTKPRQLRGFTVVSQERIEAFYEQYDDLYSVLVRIQRGEPVSKKVDAAESPLDESPFVPLEPEIIEEVLRSELVSDHVKMQWKLARLGIKAGERVWVPAGDQEKLRRTYQFDSFDKEFQAGIDLPHSYMENIDVVWKQEFRIGAAYEIENSTSIYSGLLRFADLNIMAPNTLYPMFIVAPSTRKNRLREQLRRPAFKRLELDKKVRFLSYETIESIDQFFSSSESGLNVDLIVGRSEMVT